MRRPKDPLQPSPPHGVRVIAAIGIAAAIALLWATHYLGRSPIETAAPRVLPKSDRRFEASIPAQGDSSEVEFAQVALDEARLRYDAARLAVSNAEAVMLESERDLEDLERFIEDLEEQGEDPANHAEEGMKRFMPAFEAYERASGKLDRAEDEEALARLEFLGAEQLLEAARHRMESNP